MHFAPIERGIHETQALTLASYSTALQSDRVNDAPELKAAYQRDPGPEKQPEDLRLSGIDLVNKNEGVQYGKKKYAIDDLLNEFPR